MLHGVPGLTHACPRPVVRLNDCLAGGVRLLRGVAIAGELGSPCGPRGSLAPSSAGRTGPQKSW